jgi:hypothetical protein
MLDVALPVTETSGLAFALDRDGDCDFRTAVRVADDLIEDFRRERTVVE